MKLSSSTLLLLSALMGVTTAINPYQLTCLNGADAKSADGRPCSQVCRCPDPPTPDELVWDADCDDEPDGQCALAEGCFCNRPPRAEPGQAKCGKGCAGVEDCNAVELADQGCNNCIPKFASMAEGLCQKISAWKVKRDGVRPKCFNDKGEISEEFCKYSM